MSIAKVIAAATAIAQARSSRRLHWHADSAMTGHISIVPSEIQWTDAPSIGPGAKLAILEGDLKQAVPFTMRIKLPPNFKVPAYTHPTFEQVTVLSGMFPLGIGETFDRAKARAYPAGGVAMMPPGMPMFAYTTDEETSFRLTAPALGASITLIQRKIRARNSWSA